jgi:hypothetical protein
MLYDLQATAMTTDDLSFAIIAIPHPANNSYGNPIFISPNHDFSGIIKHRPKPFSHMFNYLWAVTGYSKTLV